MTCPDFFGSRAFVFHSIVPCAVPRPLHCVGVGRTLVLHSFVGQVATLMTNEPNVQECDATKASLIFFSRVQKTFLTPL